MRILFAIPHYFTRDGTGAHGSEGGSAEARARAIRLCLASLQQHFAESQALTNGRGGVRIHSANPGLSATITIALCTTGDRHLVPELEGCPFNHIRTNAEPPYLGFECHKVLRSGLGRYDYFAYLEDDLRLADGLFFTKLAWFNSEFGDNAVLQPNRFELVDEPAPYKLYIDGNLHDPSISPALQHLDDERHIEAAAFGQRIAFQRVDNPHSGCSKAPRRSASCNISAPTSRPAKTPLFSRSSISTGGTSARSSSRYRASPRPCGAARPACGERPVVPTRRGSNPRSRSARHAA